MLLRGAKLRFGFVIVAVSLALIGGSSAADAQNSTTAILESRKGLTDQGGRLYRSRCAKCHGRKGEGQRQGHDAAPRLVGNFARLSVEEIAVQVIRGGSYMPPFDSLTDREIAAVATYIRNSFGNDLGIATEAEVAANR